MSVFSFSNLTPSEKDALVRKAMEESRKPNTVRPGDFHRAIEEQRRKEGEPDKI